MKYIAHKYQEYATNKILDQEAVGLFLDMGLGKTIITLTAINELMYNRFEIRKVLVIAPKRVALDTWTREAAKWDHLSKLTVSRVLGTAKERLEALEATADVYVTNRENVAWLVGLYKGKKNPWPFDMIVIDELSSFKSPSAVRFRALRKVRPLATRVVGLTGTPNPNGYLDLWSQVYLLDQGARLGKTFTAYRNDFFKPGRMNPSTRVVYDWNMEDWAKGSIDKSLQDLCVSMKAEDYLDMPEYLPITTPVVFDPEQTKQYKKLERDYLLTIDQDTITAATAAAVTGKLQQFAQGAVYNTEGGWTEIHNAKLEALDELIEAANGNPLLVFYWYKHDLARLKAKYPKARTLDDEKDIADWNTGRVPLMLAHPSAGYGLNLQDGGNQVIWFTLPAWNLELYQQANARLYRQGQAAKTVIIQHLVAQGTIDEDMMLSLAGKAEDQDNFMASIKARIKTAQEEGET